MSRENVKVFYEKLKTDENLAQELMKIRAELEKGDEKLLNDEYVVNKKIIPLAKKYGLSFTADEFALYTREQLTELGEEDLLNVNGGVIPGLAWFASITSMVGSLFGGGVAANTNPPTQVVEARHENQDTTTNANRTGQTEDNQQNQEDNENVPANEPERVVVHQQGVNQEADGNRFREMSNDEYERQVEQLRQSLKEKDEKIKAIEVEFAETERALQASCENAEWLNKKLEDMEEARKELMANVTSRVKEINKLKKELKEMQAKLEATKKENEQLKQSLKGKDN